MSTKSPFTTQIERGGYTAIVYKDGDLYVAEDNLGIVIKQSSNAASVIQAAVDEGGKTYLIGSFSIDDTINLPSDAYLEGARFNTIITQTANKPVLSIVGTVGAKKYRVTIKDMYLYGTSPSTNTDQYGVRMKYASNTVLDGVNFYNLYDGVHAETWFYVTWMYGCNFDSQIEHNAVYLHADADWDANTIFMTDCYVTSKGNNIDYTHLMGLHAKGTYFKSSAGYNIYGVRSYGLNVFQCDFDGAIENAIHENESMQASRLVGYWMIAGKKGVYIHNCYDVVISSCQIHSHHTGIDFNDGSKITITGVNMIDSGYSPASTYPAIKLGTGDNVHDVVINGCLIGHADNTYSIEEKAGNLHNVIVGNSFQKAASLAAGTEHAHNYSP